MDPINHLSNLQEPQSGLIEDAALCEAETYSLMAGGDQMIASMLSQRGKEASQTSVFMI